MNSTACYGRPGCTYSGTATLTSAIVQVNPWERNGCSRILQLWLKTILPPVCGCSVLEKKETVGCSFRDSPFEPLHYTLLVCFASPWATREAHGWVALKSLSSAGWKDKRGVSQKILQFPKFVFLLHWSTNETLPKILCWLADNPMVKTSARNAGTWIWWRVVTHLSTEHLANISLGGITLCQ